MSGFVYLWENTLNGMYYIGSHKGDVNDGYIGSGKYFKPAYNKNPQNFVRKILYIGDDFLNYEEELLEFIDVKNNDRFYNLVNKVGAGWYSCHTKESRIKQANSLRGKKASKETRDKMTIRRKGSGNAMYGKKHSDLTKSLISESKKGKTVNSKNVIEVFSKKVFKSLTDCAKYYKVTQPTITSHLKKGEIIKRGKLKNKKLIYV